MDKVAEDLTVFFEKPFWVGVFECTDNGKLSVCKVTFGAEPTDGEIWEFILKEYYNLKFSPAVDTVVRKKSVNPKRRQREVKRKMQDTGIGTRSQQAIKLQQEQNKLQRKIKSKEIKTAEIRRRFVLKQQKKKDKHKGH